MGCKVCLLLQRNNFPRKKVSTYVTENDPASEITGEAAAALAATHIALKSHDPAFAENLLKHSRELYEFAKNFPGTFMTSQTFGFVRTKAWYPSMSYKDELAWAALWLYRATGEQKYMNDVRDYYKNPVIGWSFDWDGKDAGIHVLMTKLTGDTQAKNLAKQFFDQYLPGPARTVPHTPKGLGFRFYWGSLRYAGNTAFISLLHARTLERENPSYAQSLREYGASQINYMLGDSGRSSIVGFGSNYPLSPYHKSSYNTIHDFPTRYSSIDQSRSDFLNSPVRNREILYGAVVGGI